MSELDQYDFDLPRELIAQHPLANRSDSRLMLVNRQTGEIEHSHVRDLYRWLLPGDAIVFNNSRVVPAKLVGYRRETQGRWQGLYLRHDPATGVWELLTKTRGTLRTGELLVIQDRAGRDAMEMQCLGRTEDGNLLVKPLVNSSGRGEGASEQPPDPYQLLESIGRIPLPPYIRDGQMVDADVEDYQTVYASQAGSVAAPTAGLHFTPSLLKALERREVQQAMVTLHVGIGTFRPITASRLADHKMHSEWASIGQAACDTINQCRSTGGRCVAVGTTSVRVLESAVRAQAATPLLAPDGSSTSRVKLTPWTGDTDLFITPGFEFKAVDALMTNFHLPKSSLMVLVSSLAGHELIRRAYREAVQERYRFFSYGDAMLIY